jgi:hypothetical protein
MVKFRKWTRYETGQYVPRGHRKHYEEAGNSSTLCGVPWISHDLPSTHLGHELVAAGMLIMAGGCNGKPLDYEELER